MSLLDPITAAGPATALETTGEPVDVSQATPPTPGQVLTAVDAEHAQWSDPTGGEGGPGTANALVAPWNGEGASIPITPQEAPPQPGQALTYNADSSEAVEWDFPTAQRLTSGVEGEVVAITGGLPDAGDVLTALGPLTMAWQAPAAPVVNPPLTSMYWAPQPTPNAADDYFVDGSPVLLERGWHVTDAGTGLTEFTRAGEVLVYAPPNSIPAGQYRSTITKSGLLFQCSQACNIWKLSSQIGGWDNVAFDVWHSWGVGLTTTSNYFTCGVCSVSTPPSDANTAQTRLFWQVYGGGVTLVKQTAGVTYANLQSATVPAGGAGSWIFRHNSATTGYDATALDPITGTIFLSATSQNTTGINAGTAIFFGMQTATTLHRSWHHIRSARRLAAGGWPGVP